MYRVAGKMRTGRDGGVSQWRKKTRHITVDMDEAVRLAGDVWAQEDFDIVVVIEDDVVVKTFSQEEDGWEAFMVQWYRSQQRLKDEMQSAGVEQES